MQTSLLLVGLACIIAAVVAGGLKLVGVEIPPISSVARQALLAIVGVAAVLVSFFQPFPESQPSPSPTPSPTASTTPPDPSPAPHADPVAYYSFDRGVETDSQGNRYVVDQKGGHRGDVKGGALQPIERGQGKALRFPGRCTQPPADCPKVMIDVADVAEFNPGTRDFSYGADLLLRPDEKTPIANVVENGFGVGGFQWKLQLRDGVPHCVLYRQDPPATTFRARGTVSMADGKWHTVECVRTGEELTLRVDSARHGSASLPAGLDVSTTGLVHIGAKNVKDDNNQFWGALDNVFYKRAR